VTNTFFISDTHFGHSNIALKFTLDDEVTPARIDPRTGERFTCVEEMDQFMIDNWNKVVNKQDRVYHLGDFCMKRRDLQVLNQLNGRIYMLLGNHDPWKKRDWEQFKNVDHLGGAKMFPKLGWICTHIPVNERQFYGRWKWNIHGHTHTNHVMSPGYYPYTLDSPDERYVNICVENIDYTPIELEELKLRCEEYE
jgi:calcineurin-like phosphoesterase family protein